jgi:hypothetical protein
MNINKRKRKRRENEIMRENMERRGMGSEKIEGGGIF